MEPKFVDKDNVPENSSLIGVVEASEAIVDTPAGSEPLTLLHSRVRDAVIRKVAEEHGTHRRYFLVSTGYDIEDLTGGKTGSATCEVYRINL